MSTGEEVEGSGDRGSSSRWADPFSQRSKLKKEKRAQEEANREKQRTERQMHKSDTANRVLTQAGLAPEQLSARQQRAKEEEEAQQREVETARATRKAAREAEKQKRLAEAAEAQRIADDPDLGEDVDWSELTPQQAYNRAVGLPLNLPPSQFKYVVSKFVPPNKWKAASEVPGFSWANHPNVFSFDVVGHRRAPDDAVYFIITVYWCTASQEVPRRFREFHHLQFELVKRGITVNSLPPKQLCRWCTTTEMFLDSRERALYGFLADIMASHELSAMIPGVRSFLRLYEWKGSEEELRVKKMIRRQGKNKRGKSPTPGGGGSFGASGGDDSPGFAHHQEADGGAGQRRTGAAGGRNKF